VPSLRISGALAAAIAADIWSARVSDGGCLKCSPPLQTQSQQAPPGEAARLASSLAQRTKGIGKSVATKKQAQAPRLLKRPAAATMVRKRPASTDREYVSAQPGSGLPRNWKLFLRQGRLDKYYESPEGKILRSMREVFAADGNR
jgi:hypothetical protein